MDVRFVPLPRAGAFAQFGRYKAEVVDRGAGTALETTSLRVALLLADLLNDDETGELGSPPGPVVAEGRFEYLVNEPWCLVVHLRGSVADQVARSRDAALAARAARLLAVWCSWPLPGAKKPKTLRWWPSL